MATQPIAEPLVSLEEYLDSDFQPDREFNDGVIEERNWGNLITRFCKRCWPLSSTTTWATGAYSLLPKRGFS